MSESDYVPTSTIVSCTICKQPVSLVSGDLLRKHLDQGLDPDLPRRERICPGSGTDQWTTP